MGTSLGYHVVITALWPLLFVGWFIWTGTCFQHLLFGKEEMNLSFAGYPLSRRYPFAYFSYIDRLLDEFIHPQRSDMNIPHVDI